MWKLTIGNDLGLTRELFDQFETIAREKLIELRQIELDADADELLMSTNLLSHSNDNNRAYFQFIQLDVSRTFPQLGLFQENGPYHGKNDRTEIGTASRSEYFRTIAIVTLHVRVLLS